MRRVAIASLALLLLGVNAQVAIAQEKIEENPPQQPDIIPGSCSVDGYKFLNSGPLNLTVPDGDPTGVVTPPIQLPADGTMIEDVIVDMQFEHTWLGDMIIELRYDHDCNPATPFTGPVSLVCRQQLAGCPVDGCCGCSADLISGGRYVWGTIGANKEMAEPVVCPVQIDHGCYLVAAESQFDLSVFNGLPKGGCWTLHLVDGAGLDLGILHDWTIYLDNGGVIPAEPTSWGGVKAAYQD